MAEIIKMDNGYRFCVYTHRANNGEDKVLDIPMIVLKREDGSIAKYTGYEVFFGPYKYKRRNDVPDGLCLSGTELYFLPVTEPNEGA